MNIVCMLTLLSAIHFVESDCGLTSKNELQITSVCLNDVNRIVRQSGGDWQYMMEDRYNLAKSRGIAVIYLCHYGNRYKLRTGKEPTAEIYAKLWRVGYNGLFDPARRTVANAYWKRVNHRLKTLEKEETK